MMVVVTFGMVCNANGLETTSVTFLRVVLGLIIPLTAAKLVRGWFAAFAFKSLTPIQRLVSVVGIVDSASRLLALD